MALIVKTDSQNIKDSLLKGEETLLYKEEVDKQFVIRLIPLHAPIPESQYSLLRNEDNCYFQIRSWAISKLDTEQSFTAQVNIQLTDGSLYHFIGLEITIDKITEIDELSFTKFTDILDKSMNYLKPFSVF